MRITLYLLRDGAPATGDVLRDASRFREVAVHPATGITWNLLVSGSPPSDASWVKNLRPIVVSDKLPECRTSSSSAVLLAEHDGRVFAVTFGHGFHALDPQYVERGFGLRVTANVIAATRVTSADTRGMSGTGRNQKTILSTASALYDLGIEPTEEWVRQLSGKVTEQDFAATAAGADSLRLTIKDFALPQLPEKLARIRERFEATDYTKDFAFLDNFIRLDRSDPLVDELDEIVERMVRSRDDSLSFAAPDPFEQLHVDRYGIKYRREIQLDHLGRDEVLDAVHDLGLRDGLLRRMKISAYDDAGQVIDKRYDLYDYVQAEVPRADARYVLTAGTWFRVSDDYVAQIHEYVRDIDDLTGQLALPDWDRTLLKADPDDKTLEGSYNIIAARDLGCALLDKKNVHIGGPHQKIGICDLLSTEKQLICVKQASRSSTLSHLFAQGGVSASLMNDMLYQRHVMAHLRTLDTQAVYGTPSDWTFIYAIAIDKPGRLADSLFFFSQANLVTHARDIRSRGFRVALCLIPMV
jgi:uncharacterized protein (TIGR04141 family)